MFVSPHHRMFRQVFGQKNPTRQIKRSSSLLPLFSSKVWNCFPVSSMMKDGSSAIPPRIRFSAEWSDDRVHRSNDEKRCSYSFVPIPQISKKNALPRFPAALSCRRRQISVSHAARHFGQTVIFLFSAPYYSPFALAINLLSREESFRYSKAYTAAFQRFSSSRRERSSLYCCFSISSSFS